MKIEAERQVEGAEQAADLQLRLEHEAALEREQQAQLHSEAMAVHAVKQAAQ
jgi:hypothetical protein